LRPLNGERLRAGAHLVAHGMATIAANDQGYITSTAFSPTLGHWIALALLNRGPERHGERMIVHDPVRAADIEAEVCHPVFVDAEGTRIRG
jgi:glycine cleavage system aminomethyltransferase T